MYDIPRDAIEARRIARIHYNTNPLTGPRLDKLVELCLVRYPQLAIQTRQYLTTITLEYWLHGSITVHLSGKPLLLNPDSLRITPSVIASMPEAIQLKVDDAWKNLTPVDTLRICNRVSHYDHLGASIVNMRTGDLIWQRMDLGQFDRNILKMVEFLGKEKSDV